MAIMRILIGEFTNENAPQLKHDSSLFWGKILHGYSTNQPPGPRTPPRNKGLIFGLIKGNQWLICPDHKALLLGGVRGPGGGPRLTSRESWVFGDKPFMDRTPPDFRNLNLFKMVQVLGERTYKVGTPSRSLCNGVTWGPFFLWPKINR